MLLVADDHGSGCTDLPPHRWVSHLPQRAVTHLWRTEAADTDAMAAAYARRRDGLVEALAARRHRARRAATPGLDEIDALAAALRLASTGRYG
ncbi:MULTISPECIES: hypothetical protein [unclassified Nonomuraea]|uniref:hypothetical protein n=1 Tax=unclassified Nonomuraea TaxID=2593643 RepID=UPI00191BD4D7|nr:MULTISPECIES: hypothetical protein [unclassified Nonomuraea]